MSHYEYSVVRCGRGLFFLKDDTLGWRLGIPITDGSNIIRCRKCDKPATQIDHYYPYYDENNSCDDHISTEGGIQCAS